MGYYELKDEKRNGLFLKLQDGHAFVVFAKDGVEIEFPLETVCSVIEQFDKALIPPCPPKSS
jgi:hypothetical protein